MNRKATAQLTVNVICILANVGSHLKHKNNVALNLGLLLISGVF